jgi:hypothetical protein
MDGDENDLVSKRPAFLILTEIKYYNTIFSYLTLKGRGYHRNSVFKCSLLGY